LTVRIIETRFEEGEIKFGVHQSFGRIKGINQEQRGEEEDRGLERLRG
jgi:hypothetical protein